MFNKLKYVLSFMKALKLDENGKYYAAINTLQKHASFIKCNKNKFPDYYILLGELFAKIVKYTESEQYFLIALDAIDDTKIFNLDEKNYLKKYIYQWLIFIYAENNHTISEKKYQKLIDAIIYNNQKIRSSFKINFPISSLAPRSGGA